MSEPVILVEKKDRVATVTLNRSDSMNAMSAALRVAISNAFADLNNDPDIGVAILTGAGRAFCAGVDLKEASIIPEKVANLKNEVSGMVSALDQFKKPIIGAINGVAATGGFELALACDIIIASTEAQFADTHARVGFLPGWAMSQKLSRLIGFYRANEMSLTGNFITAQKALEWGLVNRVVAPDRLLSECLLMAKDILSCPGDIIVKYKKLIKDGFQMTLRESIELEQEIFVEQFHAINSDMVSNRTEAVMERGRKQQK